MGDLGHQPVGILQGFRSLEVVKEVVYEAELIVPQLFQVFTVHKACKIGQRVYGEDDILVELKGVGAPGNGPQLFTVPPEPLCLLLAGGGGESGLVKIFQNCFKGLLPRLNLSLVLPHHVNEEHGFEAALSCSLGLVVDGFDVLFVKMFQGDEGGIRGPLVEVFGDDADHLACFPHVPAEELQHKGPFEGIFRIENEAGVCDDAVASLFLDSWKPSQGFVGHVLAQTWFADLLPL